MTKLQRLLAIVQLCITFTLILWYLFQPFMGEYYALKSRLILMEFVMGIPNVHSQLSEVQLEANQKRFIQLKEAQQVSKDYQEIHQYASRPALTKISDGISLLFREISLFELSWLFFATLVSILLLKETPGAREVVWILPLLALLFAGDNLLFGTPSKGAQDRSLFPNEEQLVAKPLEGSWLEQREQLQKGWEGYLLSNWSFGGDLAAAEFNFAIERLKALTNHPREEWLAELHSKKSVYLLFCYVAWNLYFAYSWRSHKKKVDTNACKVAY